MMPYVILADLVLVSHVAFVVFVVTGGFLVLRWKHVAWIHVPCALWGAWVELSGSVCPLTPLENALRRKAGQAGYAEGFLDHYIVPLLYPPGLTRDMMFAVGVGVLALNVAVYVWAWRRRRP